MRPPRGQSFDKPVLNGITLTVPKGQVLGYLGANGAGKTTTIKILTGQLKPSRGAGAGSRRGDIVFVPGGPTQRTAPRAAADPPHAMDPYLRERIENWAGDFCASDRFAEVKGAVREHAAQVLVSFLSRACESRGREPGEVEEPDAKAGLLEGVAKLSIPETARGDVPALCALFLEEMQREGRIAGGRALGLFVKALKEPYLEAAGGKSRPYRAPAAAIGRNDPCPCGSGKKYKKCCLGRP